MLSPQTPHTCGFGGLAVSEGPCVRDSGSESRRAASQPTEDLRREGKKPSANGILVGEQSTGSAAYAPQSVRPRSMATARRGCSVSRDKRTTIVITRALSATGINPLLSARAG